jgi:hypothetical protein
LAQEGEGGVSVTNDQRVNELIAAAFRALGKKLEYPSPRSTADEADEIYDQVSRSLLEVAAEILPGADEDNA